MSTVFALIARTHGTYANRNTMACSYAHIVLGGEEMKKRRKFNFWELLPKISMITASVFAVYIAHREYTGTGNITGLSAVVPLAIVVYFIVTQVVEALERKRKD